MHKIISIFSPKDDAKKLLGNINLSDVDDIYFCDNAADAKIHTKDATILFGRPPELIKIVDDTPNLQWIHSSFTGVDALFNSPRRDYLLSNTRGIYGQHITEYVIGHLILIERNFLKYTEQKKQAIWKHHQYSGLANKTIGIMGYGSIGSHLSKVSATFGMNVWVYRHNREKPSEAQAVFVGDQLKDFLKGCDYVVNVLPATEETSSLINSDAFDHMKDQSIFINVGRASVVDSEALVAALRDGRIRSAVLDVFPEEPLPDSSPLWEMDNVFVTPHNAARGSSSDILGQFVENYNRFIKGQELKNIVNFERGY